MAAAVMLGQDFHVFVAVPTVEGVLDAEIREAHSLVEVRQVVLTCPRLDLSCVTIGSSVAVGAAPVVLLQEGLILALQVLFQDDAADVCSFLSQAILDAQISGVQRGVVRQLARPEDVRVERLLPLVVAIAAMRVEQMLPSVSQRHSSLASVEGDAADQSLVAQVPQAFITRIPDVALRHDPECACGAECAAVLQVQFVAVIAVENELAFEATRQVELSEEDVARVVVPLTRVAITVTRIVVTLSRVIIKRIIRRTAPELYPMHVDVTWILVAVPWIVPSRIVAAIHGIPFQRVNR